MKNRFSPEYYDTIIFDLGEVIVNLDSQAVISRLMSLSENKEVDFKKLIVTSPILQLFETGKISEAEFRKEMKALLNMQIPDNEFDEIWNAMLKSIPRNKLDLMKTLQSSYRVLILSNTNIIHQRKFDEMVGEIAEGRKMSDFVDFAHYSHDLGYRKPNPDIYKEVIDRHDLIPKRTIFLDDRPENIESAKSLGIEAIRVEYPDQIFDILGV